MKLYYSPTSPHVRKCLVVAAELGMDEDIERVPARAHPIERDQALIEHNPLGRVPTLLTDEGLVLHDSRVICEYLDARAGGRLVPRDGAARWQVLTQQSLADGMLNAALMAHQEYTLREPSLRWPLWHEAQMAKIDASLAMLDRPGVLRLDGVDLGRIGVSCALWYLDLRFEHHDWRARHPTAAQWYAQYCQRPSMQKRWND